MPQYQEYAHPGVQEFWGNLPQNQEHILSQHPLFRDHGENLSRSGYNQLHQRIEEQGAQGADPMEIFQRIMEKEQAHTGQLEELAKQAVVQVWGIDPSMLDAELTQDVSVEAGESPEPRELTPEIQGEINKRLTMNSLTHGAAVHQMQSLHFVIGEAIQAIDPELMELYSQLASTATQQYWVQDVVSVIEGLSGSAGVGGTEEVQFDDAGNPKVIAKAIAFPILAQELAKGVMELLTMHGLSDMDEQTAATVIEHADDVRHEFWLTQAGQELWRLFLQAMPQDANIADIVSGLSRLPPDQVQQIVEAVVTDPQNAQEYLSRAVASKRVADDNAGTLDRFLSRESQAAPAAPPITRPAPQTTPAPAPTEPGPAKPDPFRPTQPKVSPKPKAEEEEQGTLDRFMNSQ